MRLTRYLYDGTLHRGKSYFFRHEVATLCGRAFPLDHVRTPWLPFLHPACGMCEAVHQISAADATRPRNPFNPFA